MPSWKETLRSWLNSAPRRKPRPASKLNVSYLEDRVTPVVGSFDVPFAVDFDTTVGATDLSGVVSVNGATGALIDRGTTMVGSRHVLTSASAGVTVGSDVTFFSRATDGTVRSISVPVSAVWTHPAYNPVTFANDVAVLTLAAVAPEYANDYPIYLGSFGSEINRPFYLAGFGLTGTGTSGEAAGDLQRLSVTATGGSYRLQSPGSGLTTAPIPYNATPLQVQTALTAIGENVQVLSPQFGPFVTVNNQFYSYEIRYLSAANARRLQFVAEPSSPLVNGGNNGIVTVQTLTNGLNDGDLQRLTINGTAGTFRLGLGTAFTGQLPFNATEAQIQTALESLAAVTEVTVRRIPDGAASGAGSFQIVFDAPNTRFPVLTVDTTQMTGTGIAYILQHAGDPVLRMGMNEYAGASGTVLTYNFATDGTDAMAGTGDRGSPGFIDVGSGKLALATVMSNGNNKFNDVQQATRISKFTTDITNVIDAKGYAATIDMQYQLGGGDGIADTFRVTQTADGFIQVFVRDSKIGPERLFFQDAAANVASVVLRGTADDDTFIIESSVSVLVSIEGGGGKNVVQGPNINTLWTITGADEGTGGTAKMEFNFKGVRQLIGGSADDTFKFATGGTLSNSIDGGTGSDTIDFSTRAASNITVTAMGTIDGAVGTIGGSVPLAGQFRNIDNIIGSQLGTTDLLRGPNSGGTWTQNGVGGSYVDTASGKSFNYSNFEALFGGSGNDTFNIVSVSTGLTLDGGGGANAANFDGTAGNDSVVLSFTGAGSGSLAGLAKTINYSKIGSVNFDGMGGSNAFRFQDASGKSYGAPTDPGSGIVFTPNGPSSGSIRVAGASTFGLAAINNGLTVDGGGNGSTFLVLGTSGAGLQSGFGETVLGNGRDEITVSDSHIAITSVSAGPLLGVTPFSNSGSPSFATIYVAGGNEPLNQGDVFTVTPSLSVNLIVDGQGPGSSARPGDRVILNTTSPTTSVFVNDPSIGPPMNQVTQTSDGARVGLVGIESGAPRVPGQGMIAVSTDAGPLTTVQVFDSLTGAFRFEVVPFEEFYLGATVGSGDFNGDGIADLIVGAGPGGGPRVAIFNGLDGSLMADFFAYEDTFRGGVNVSAADFNGDGRADLVLGTGVGGGPRVRVLSGLDLSVIRDVFVYESTFRGGVNVSAGDFNGDGTPDLITSAGTGGGPRVVVLSGTNLQSIASFFVFDPNSRSGFYAAAGDVNGDGYADVIAGAGAGEPARVRVISGLTRQVLSDFYVNDPLEPGNAIPSIPFDAGVRVASADVNGDGIDDVITVKGPGSLPTVRVYQLGGVDPVTNALFPTLAEIARFDAFDGMVGFGLYVGASN
jgi:hypothetical protein